MHTVAALSRRILVSSFLISISIFRPVPCTAQSDTGRHGPPPTIAPLVPVDHEQFICYWTTETGWHSELQLRNNLIAQELAVTPILRSSDGTETALSPVTIKPNEIRIVDLEAAVMGSAPQYIGTFGSLALRYYSPSAGNLFAMLMLRNIGHSIAYHFDAVTEDPDVQGGSREGIWWLPNETANDYLVLANLGSNLLPLDLYLYDSTGRSAKHRIVLAPRNINRLSVRQLVYAFGLVGTFGGIKVFTASHAGSLDSLHILFDQKTSFSAQLKMFDKLSNPVLAERDYAHTNIWTLRAPMLALSNPDPALAMPEGTLLQPQLFVRNTLAKPVEVGLRFNWRGESKITGKSVAPSFRLGPYETRRVDIAALQASNSLPKQANWASVVLTTNSLPDEIVAIAASYDQSLRYGAQTPFSDQLAFHWEGSLWEFDAQHNSLITAGNGGTKPLEASFTIYYNQGTKKYQLKQTLQPDEQMWVDVGGLIRERIPDIDGNVLPDELTTGSYEIRDLTNKGVGNIFEGKIVYDKTYGHVTYGCANCCGFGGPVFQFNPLSIPLGYPQDNFVDAYDYCNSYLADVSDSFYNNWNTANHSIATVDIYGTHTGVALGTTRSTTSGTLQTDRRPYCPNEKYTPSGNDNVNNCEEPLYSASCTTSNNGANATLVCHWGAANTCCTPPSLLFPMSSTYGAPNTTYSCVNNAVTWTSGRTTYSDFCCSNVTATNSSCTALQNSNTVCESAVTH